MITAFGSVSENGLARAVQANLPEVYLAGDCIKAAKVGEAVRAGFTVGWQV